MTYLKNNYNIEDLKSEMDFEGVYALESFQKAETKTGDTYVKIGISDASGKVFGNIWQYDKFNLNNVFDSLKQGSFVKVVGNITEFREKPQLNVLELLEVDDLSDLSQELKSQLIGEPVYTRDEFIAKATKYMGMIKEPVWQGIVRDLYGKYLDDLWISPAASSMHHDMNGGLAMHIFTMAESAISLHKVYSEIYPNLNLDLMLSGVLLHDLGKVIELSGPVATHYTSVGILEGHISIGAYAVQTSACKLGYDVHDEKVNLLTHMILSHHLKGEWGSPVSPAFIEAQLLHHIDKIDADVQEFKKTEQLIDIGESINGRWHGIDGKVYHPSIHLD